jgi:hypothetical protein
MVSNAAVTPRLAVLCAAGCVAAGCGDLPAAPRPIAGNVTLGAGQYALFAGRASAGPLLFPAAGPAGAEYLVVGQFATGVADVSERFALAGASAVTAEVVGAAGGVAPSAAQRFHDAIRHMDEVVARASAMMAGRETQRAPSPVVPPALGSLRSFKVCADLQCSFTTTVTAVAQVVAAHCAIYVDTLAPANGLSGTDLQQLGQQFDNDLYPIDVNAFGSESDIDRNGVVIILLTPKVNTLIPAPDCHNSYVTGFFLGADLSPLTRADYNDGEVFYGMVPDPAGTVACSYPVALVRQVIAPTFIHEFQHMISFNQHTLVRAGSTEVLWLNEAMSHIAEELGGRHYDSLRTPAADSAASRFLIGDVYNANLYLLNPSPHPMVTVSGAGTLEERGAEWLFVRYLVDQFGSATTQHLDQTDLTGDANVVAVTGTPFATLLGRWALALWVSDLPSFTPDTMLAYRNWRFRDTYAALHAGDPSHFTRAFPLVPLAASGGSFSLSGTVNSGSGAYVDITQPPSGAAFTVTFTQPGGNALQTNGNPQLAVVRVR